MSGNASPTGLSADVLSNRAKHDIVDDLFAFLMRCPKTTLSIRQPSLSTTAYSVTNAAKNLSRPAQLFKVTRIILKLVLAGICLWLLLLELHVLTSYSWDLRNLCNFISSFLQAAVVKYKSVVRGFTGNDEYARWMLVLSYCMILWVLSRREYIEESLLVIQGLGIQTSTDSRSYLSAPTTRFIPTSQIQDIFIHEAFRGFEIRFYLAVIVVGEEDAVVVFPELLPRRAILEQVWRGAKAVLYQPTKPS